MGAKATMTMSKYGEPVDITAPPAGPDRQGPDVTTRWTSPLPVTPARPKAGDR